MSQHKGSNSSTVTLLALSAGGRGGRGGGCRWRRRRFCILQAAEPLSFPPANGSGCSRIPNHVTRDDRLCQQAGDSPSPRPPPLGGEQVSWRAHGEPRLSLPAARPQDEAVSLTRTRQPLRPQAVRRGPPRPVLPPPRSGRPGAATSAPLAPTPANRTERPARGPFCHVAVPVPCRGPPPRGGEASGGETRPDPPRPAPTCPGGAACCSPGRRWLIVPRRRGGDAADTGSASGPTVAPQPAPGAGLPATHAQYRRLPASAGAGVTAATSGSRRPRAVRVRPPSTGGVWPLREPGGPGPGTGPVGCRASCPVCAGGSRAVPGGRETPAVRNGEAAPRPAASPGSGLARDAARSRGQCAPPERRGVRGEEGRASGRGPQRVSTHGPDGGSARRGGRSGLGVFSPSDRAPAGACAGTGGRPGRSELPTEEGRGEPPAAPRSRLPRAAWLPGKRGRGGGGTRFPLKSLPRESVGAHVRPVPGLARERLTVAALSPLPRGCPRRAPAACEAAPRPRPPRDGWPCVSPVKRR